MESKYNESFRIRPQTPRTQPVVFEEDEDDVSEFAQVERIVKNPASQFSNLTKLEISIDSTETSLQVVGEHCPNITELKFKSSYVRSLRDIGTSFKNLKILKALKVGLEELEGITSFP